MDTTWAGRCARARTRWLISTTHAVFTTNNGTPPAHACGA